ncbi:hypothetical protein D3C81_1658500 [compost metagenome]
MRDLMPGRIAVAIHCDDFNAEALQGNDDFFAELAGAKQHYLGCRSRQGSTDAIDSVAFSHEGKIEMMHSRQREKRFIDLQTIANLACFGQRKL